MISKSKARLIEEALRVFKPGAFSAHAEAALRSRVAKQSGYAVERTASGWKMTVSIEHVESVVLFDTPGQVNRARQALSDLGIVGLVREGH